MNDSTLDKENFEFTDTNGILWQVEKQANKYFLLQFIGGYWVVRREVKNASFNDESTELDKLFDIAIQQTNLKP